MTVKDICSIINSAYQIKKWPGEYRIYSKTDIVFIYCDNFGKPEYYVYETSGKRNMLSDADSKMLHALIDNRYAQMYQNLHRTTAKTNSK